MKTATLFLIVLALATTMIARHAAADDAEKKTGWFDSAELSLVNTSGNSDAFTLGASNVLKRVWSDAEFSFEAGAVRSQSRGDRYGVGALGQGNFAVEDPPLQVDTERYYGKANYGRTISTFFYWFVGGDGERNKPANVDYRFTGTGGVGNIWIDEDKVGFRTFYGVNYTKEKLAVEGVNDFAGFRLGYTYRNQLTATTLFNSELAFDENFDDLDDHRSDFYNAVTVSMSEQIALKAGLRLLYRNKPALEEIKVYDIDPGRGSATELGTATIEKDKLDTTFSTSLVLTF